jgi:hypothetical protein
MQNIIAIKVIIGFSIAIDVYVNQMRFAFNEKKSIAA